MGEVVSLQAERKRRAYYDRLLEGIEDALAYANGDTSRGRESVTRPADTEEPDNG